MKLWLLKPLPVPVTAPSLVGLMTSNAILLLILIVLGLRIPRLRTFLGPKLFERRSAWKWIVLCLVAGCVGLVVLHQWGTFQELPIDAAWSTSTTFGLSLLGLVFRRFGAKRPIHLSTEEGPVIN